MGHSTKINDSSRKNCDLWVWRTFCVGLLSHFLLILGGVCICAVNAIFFSCIRPGKSKINYFSDSSSFLYSLLETSVGEFPAKVAVA